MSRIIAAFAVLLSLAVAVPAFAQSQISKNPLQIGLIVHVENPRTLPGGMEGWLLCDGRPVPAELPELIEVIGKTLPNLPPIDMQALGVKDGGEAYAYIRAIPLVPAAPKSTL
jgi:hypothetical protein